MDSTAFHFKTKIDLTILLGMKATTVSELLAGINSAPESSIYFHTHKFLRLHQAVFPEPLNDFSMWVTNALNENTLGERISGMDMIQIRTLADLRIKLVDLLDDFLSFSVRDVEAAPGEEFHFMSSQSFIVESPYVARTLDEFVNCLDHISPSSLFYHIFDARLRMNREENDFSEWFRKTGNESLAEAMQHIDPYSQTLESLRRNIIKSISIHAKH